MDLNKDIKDINFNIDIATITILYTRYKSFILPVVIILACILLFFSIISPQIQSVLSQKEQQNIEEAKLSILKNNYLLLSNMDQAELDSNYKLLVGVLPSTKDFAGIINSISANAASSGVSIGDFHFSVGNVTNLSDGSSFPSIQIDLNILGSLPSTINYIDKLYKSSPLAEVTSIQANEGSAIIAVKFFYKAYPQTTISDETTIIPFSAAEKNLIATLLTWQNNSELAPLILNIKPQASSSSSLEQQTASESSSTNPF